MGAIKGQKFTEEHKRKLSESHMGKVFSEETRKKISEALKGKTVSEETRKKMSESAKKRGTSNCVWTDELKAQAAAARSATIARKKQNSGQSNK